MLRSISTVLGCLACAYGTLSVSAAETPAATAAEVGPLLPKSVAQAEQMEKADALPMTAFYHTPSLEKTTPGALLRQETFVGYSVPTGVTAVRILYHSRNADDKDVATSGVVLVPPGRAPAGGWPVIAWAHGTTGVARACAPSLMKDFEYGEEGLYPMVRAGYAVVATDYHGLGTSGPHQYVDKLAQGRDVIYSIPAARAAVPALGRRWVVDGHSQGGMTAWSVAEMQAKLKDPDYLGSVSVSGAADLRDILDSMGKPGSFGTFYLAYMAFGIQALTPQFQPADMLQGHALERFNDATSKGCWYYTYASFLSKRSETVLQSGWDENAAVKRFFNISKLGTEPIGGPLLVIAGEADQSVPFLTVKEKVVEACKNGISLTFRSYPGLDHDPAMGETIKDQLSWIKDRFAGKTAGSNCASLL